MQLILQRFTIVQSPPMGHSWSKEHSNIQEEDNYLEYENRMYTHKKHFDRISTEYLKKIDDACSRGMKNCIVNRQAKKTL